MDGADYQSARRFSTCPTLVDWRRVRHAVFLCFEWGRFAGGADAHQAEIAVVTLIEPIVFEFPELTAFTKI
jgi:hypothetical protein